MKVFEEEVGVRDVFLSNQLSKRQARNKAIRNALRFSDLTVAFIGREFRDLKFSYIEPIMIKIEDLELGATLKTRSSSIEFQNSSRIFFCAVRDIRDALKLAGFSLDITIIDRLHEFDSSILPYLYWRGRSSRLKAEEGFPLRFSIKEEE